MSDAAHAKKFTYLMVSRKRTITEIVVLVVLFVGIVASFQYTNYVSRKLCGIIILSDKASANRVPTTDLQKQAILEFKKLRQDYGCS